MARGGANRIGIGVTSAVVSSSGRSATQVIHMNSVVTRTYDELLGVGIELSREDI